MLAPGISSLLKVLYNPQAFFTHAAWLAQGCPHCPIFPTAASRRSLGRVSVPVWPFTLSGRLPVLGLVGIYPTNYLIGRRLIFKHEPKPTFGRIRPRTWSHRVLAQVSLGCPRLKGRLSTCYSPVRHLLFKGIATNKQLVRLACVRHAASVSPEPGSNSPHNTRLESKLNRVFFPR